MCDLWFQEGMKILNRFGYKNQSDHYLIMAENFRPENCFVIRVCICIILNTIFVYLCIFRNLDGWMFLLVPAHPGCPGQSPESRKMVVCECVWLCVF